jgi:leucyl aminopeptidase
LKRFILAVAAAALLPASVSAQSIEIDFSPVQRPASGALALPVGTDGRLEGLALEADRAARGAIVQAMATAGFKGEGGSTLKLYGAGPYSAVLLVGVGDGLKSENDLRRFGGTVAQATSGWTSQTFVSVPDMAGIANDAAHSALGATLGSYDFGKWNASRNEPAPPARRLTFLSNELNATRKVWSEDFSAVAEGVVFARDLISTPSNIKSPAWMAEQVEVKFQDVRNVSVTVLDEAQIEALGMGALYGTGQGSVRPPRLVAISYTGGAPDTPPLAFIGKGITFDTGGISIKPNQNMWRMRMDMSGAAASAGAVLSLAKRGADVNAVAVLPLAENMPDANAIRPGDVLTSINGKTIEVLNTDAEGRLVLADALWWTQEQYTPQLAVSIATLTGSVVGALGADYAGLFSTDDALADRFLSAGQRTGENLWRLPVGPSHVSALKGGIADVRNIADSGPGASIGAAFVMEWAKPETPFVHLDIAGTAWSDAGSPTTPKGAAGFGVLLFDEIARGYERR